MNQKPTLAKSWGMAVQAQRMARGWTQAELARRVGINRSTVSATEAGRRGDPILRTVYDYGQAMGIPAAALIHQVDVIQGCAEHDEDEAE